MIPELETNGNPKLDVNDNIITKEDTELKNTLNSVYKKGVDAVNK